jgi:hypothetical protein
VNHLVDQSLRGLLLPGVAQ